MRLLRQLKLLITHDDAGDDIAFEEREFARAEASSATTPAFTVSTSGNVAIAASATKSLSLGDLTTATFVYIETNVDIEVTIDGRAPILLKVGSETTAVLYLETEDVAAISIENVGDAAGSVVYAFAGT